MVICLGESGTEISDGHEARSVEVINATIRTALATKESYSTSE